MPGVRIPVSVGLVLALAAAAAGQDKQKFEVKFEANKPFYQRLTTTVAQDLKVQNGADVPLRHEQTFFFKWTPVTVEKDKAVVKQQIEGVRFKVDIAGQTVEYDSTDPNPTGAAGNPGLNEFFSSLKGSEFTVTLEKGVVTKVEGREEMLKKLQAVNPQMEQLLRRVLTDEALKEMTDPSGGVTPNPPAEKAVGESWTRTGTLSLGPIGSYKRDLAYTYKGKDAEKKDHDLVEVKPTLTYQPPQDGGEGLPFRIKGGNLQTQEKDKDGKPVTAGTILYNPATGRVTSVRMSAVLTGTLDVAIGATETKVSLFQTQTTVLDTDESSLLPAAKK